MERLDQLDWPTLQKVLLIGYRLNSMTYRIKERDNRIEVLRLPLERGGSFPDRAFSLILTCWSDYILLFQNRQRLFKMLKDNGILGILIPMDNSPRLILDVLRRWTKISYIGFPRSRGELRGWLEDTGFYNTLIWEDAMRFPFKSIQQALQHFSQMGGKQILQGVNVQMVEAELTSILTRTGTLNIEYQYLGAICQKK